MAQEINWQITAQDRTEAAFRSVDSRISGLARGFKTLAGFTGFAALGAGLVTLTRDIITLASELKDVSEKLGISAEQLQVLKVAAEEGGASFQSLQSGLQFNTRLLDQVSKGSKEAAETFRRLGIDAKAFAGLDMEQRFRVLAEQIASVRDPGERLALTLAALGRGGGDLLPAMLKGADGIEAVRKQLETTNTLLSDEQVRILDQAGEDWERFFRRLQLAAAPALSRTISTLDFLLQKIGKVNFAFGDSFQGALLPEPSRAPTAGLTPEEEAARAGVAGRRSSANALKLFQEADAELQRVLKQVNAAQASAAREAAQAERERASALRESQTAAMDAAAELQGSNTVLRESVAIWEATRTPLENYYRQLDKINELYQSGFLSNDTANRAIVQAGKEYAEAAISMNDEIESSYERLLKDIKSATDGWARDLTETFFDTTQNIGDMFKNLALQIAKMAITETITKPFVEAITSGITGSIGKRASGGPVWGGRPYIVGEMGPELFVPRQSGNIVPNNAMAAPVTVQLTVNSLDPATAASVILANERLITGMVRRSVQRTGSRPRMA